MSSARAQDRVLVTQAWPDRALEPLYSSDLVVEVLPEKPEVSRRELLLGRLPGAAALLASVIDPIDHEMIQAAQPTMKIIAAASAGYDNVAVGEARRAGIQVSNTPGVPSSATADLAFALILASARRVVEGHAHVLKFGTVPWTPTFMSGLDVSFGATLGIVGLGDIGMAVARRATGFDMRILATGGRVTSQEAHELGICAVELDDLLRQADIVTLHCPLTPQTRHMINARRLGLMKESAILVNTARGSIIDENALVSTLKARKIAGAALDVYEDEPEVPSSLRELATVVLTPHIGSAGQETRVAMANLAAKNICAVLRGDAPLTPVTM